MSRAATFGYSLIATAIIWAAVVLVRLIGGSDNSLFDFALFAAVGSTIAIWLVWVFVSIDQSTKEAQQGKSKRTSEGDDARLSLLLQLLDGDERRALKERLRDEMSADGEAIALEDLLRDGEHSRRTGS